MEEVRFLTGVDGILSRLKFLCYVFLGMCYNNFTITFCLTVFKVLSRMESKFANPNKKVVVYEDKIFRLFSDVFNI